MYRLRKKLDKFFLDELKEGKIVSSQVFSTYEQMRSYINRNDIKIDKEDELVAGRR